jgi:hypothetical protein
LSSPGHAVEVSIPNTSSKSHAMVQKSPAGIMSQSVFGK